MFIKSSIVTVSFLKITLFHIMTDTEYKFESDAKKLVVFSPMPKRLFINYGRTDTAPDGERSSNNSPRSTQVQGQP